MEDGFNFKQLKERILAISQATDWEVARKEWSLVSIHDADEAETCLCGHHPIIEICHIHNRVTGHSTDVGNRCVKRFLGLRSDLIFAAIKRIRKEPNMSLNADAIAYFYERDLLTSWEYNFLQNTMRKRSLSAAQMSSRTKINSKVLSAIKKRGFQGSST